MLAICAVCGLISQAVSTGYVTLTAREGRSSAVGLYVTIFYAGGSFGAFLTGLAWDRTGWPGCVALVCVMLVVMAAIFVTTWAAQSLNNWRAFNAEQLEHDDPTVSWGRYLLDPDFWERTLQNWQSEFLAVGTMAAFTIYLRQRGSPESKPVGAPHDETASSG